MKKDEKKIIHKSIDGELNKSETKVFKRKIEDDPAARAEYESLKRVSETVGEVVSPTIQVPPQFKEKVIRKITDTELRRRPK